jgi:hypothetical protein
MNRLAHIERKQNLKAERQHRAKVDDEWSERAQAETLILDQIRGGGIERAEAKRGEQRKPLRRKSGLEWLMAKGRLGSPQEALTRLDAGERYGADYQRAMDASVKSCMANMEGRVDGGQRSDGEAPSMVAAQHRVTQANVIALRSHAGMIGVTAAVCGSGLTLMEFAGTQRAADKAESVLIIALDLLAEHYGNK